FCEGSPVSQACAGIEELRKQRVAVGTEGEREKSFKGEWRESYDP
uniref:Uncharacterized protein n=1 Tax=Myotis lucifugus TaxID=59463 RepID=G1Q6S3_MYOLU